MSEILRRDFLKGTAAFAAGMTAALTATRRAEAGDPSFMNNVPDPLVSGKELPTFKFALEKSKGRVIGGNAAKEATVEQLPISKGIAGVSMRLAPGGHAGAALARHRGRVGVRQRGADPDHSHPAGRTVRDQRL
jgi:oxalate decarboxylase